MGCKPACTHMDPDVDLSDEIGPLCEDISECKMLICKLIYLTVTRLDIFYVVRLVSHLCTSIKRYSGRLP